MFRLLIVIYFLEGVSYGIEPDVIAINGDAYFKKEPLKINKNEKVAVLYKNLKWGEYIPYVVSLKAIKLAKPENILLQNKDGSFVHAFTFDGSDKYAEFTRKGLIRDQDASSLNITNEVILDRDWKLYKGKKLILYFDPEFEVETVLSTLTMLYKLDIKYYTITRPLLEVEGVIEEPENLDQ